MSAEISWKVWAKPLARHNYCIIPCQDIFFILLVVELDYINLNKLMVKMMSVLFQNICHMIMKGLVNSVFFFKDVSGALYVGIQIYSTYLISS